jgi:hypothetical protein
MIVYKTTNLINSKIYVGSDKKNNPNYLGSGKLLKQAIRKYGRENFIKEIIFECNNIEELKSKEEFWIKKLSSNIRGIGYNISDGYFGGDVFTNHPNKEIYRKKLRKAFIGKKNNMYGKNLYNIWRDKYSAEEVEEKIKNHKNRLSKSVRSAFKNKERKKVYEIWVEKYGKEKADSLQKKLNKKRKKNASNSNSNSKIVEIYEQGKLINRYLSMKEFIEKENQTMNFLRKFSKKDIIVDSTDYWNGKTIKLIKIKDFKKQISVSLT